MSTQVEKLTFEVEGTRNGKASRWRLKAESITDARRLAASAGIENAELTFVPETVEHEPEPEPEAPAPEPEPTFTTAEDPSPEPPPQPPVGLDYATLQAEIAELRREAWDNRMRSMPLARNDNQQQWVRMHPGEAFSLGFWAGIGAWFGMVALSVAIVLLLVFLGVFGGVMAHFR